MLIRIGNIIYFLGCLFLVGMLFGAMYSRPEIHFIVGFLAFAIGWIVRYLLTGRISLKP